MIKNTSTYQIDQIRSASRRVVRELGFMQNNIAGTQLSASAVHTIIDIAGNKNITAKQLSSNLVLEKSTISRLLKKLEQNKLITLVVNSQDTRVRNISLTDSGHSLFTEIEKFGRVQVSNALQHLQADDLDLVTNGLYKYGIALKKSALTSNHDDNMALNDVTIDEGYKPGLISQITSLFINYFNDCYQFNHLFEGKVATEISEFMSRIDHPSNSIFSIYSNDELLGSISIDGQHLNHTNSQCIAHLRWFIVSPKAKGLGIGKRLINRAMEFVDHSNFNKTHLWTIKGLDTARYLYDQNGFVLVEEKLGDQWGKETLEQKLERT